MPAAYMLSDVVVSASTDPEGFGRTVGEAQAMGRPVVASDHGGAREQILAERTGFLFPSEDATALAAGLRTALSLPPEARARLHEDRKSTRLNSRLMRTSYAVFCLKKQ